MVGMITSDKVKKESLTDFSTLHLLLTKEEYFFCLTISPLVHIMKYKT